MTLMEKTRCMFGGARLEQEFWGEVVSTGKKPSLTYLVVMHMFLF
jgi:hypothetical protein